MVVANLPSYISFAFPALRPVQQKALDAGLLDGKSLLVCSPTGSGKTQVAEFSVLQYYHETKGKSIYVVPLKALASEKYRSFVKSYADTGIKIGMSVGDTDSDDAYLGSYDLLITTSEKLDSLIRHRATWLDLVRLLVVDEVHLLHDAGRGPTLEMVITMLRHLVPKLQILALSATIGNPNELAQWLDAVLVQDDFRPCPLRQGILYDAELTFYDDERHT